MEINIIDYLDEEEIKNICESEIRLQIREHFKTEENAKRLLSNLAYHIVKEEINKIVPNYEQELVAKVISLIKGKHLEYQIFDFDSYGAGRAKSLGAKIVEQTIKENESLIKQKVIDSIQNKDYSDEAWNKFEALAETFTHNIYEFVELMRNKK